MITASTALNGRGRPRNGPSHQAPPQASAILMQRTTSGGRKPGGRASRQSRRRRWLRIEDIADTVGWKVGLAGSGAAGARWPRSNESVVQMLRPDHSLPSRGGLPLGEVPAPVAGLGASSPRGCVVVSRGQPALPRPAPPPVDRRRGPERDSALAVLGQDRVDLASRLVEDRDRALHLLLRPGVRHLHGRGRQLEGGPAQTAERLFVLGGDLFPGRRLAVLSHGLYPGPSRLGERVDAPALDLLAGDQPLVLEQLERGVHGAGADPPGTAGAALQLLDHL